MLDKPHGARSRPLRRAAFVASVVAAIVVAIFVVPHVVERGVDRTAESRVRSGSTHLKTRGAHDSADVDAPSTCWSGLDRFDAEVTLDRFRSWAAPLIAAGDPVVAEYLADRLAELVGDDPERARDVLAWLRDAGGEELSLLCEGLERAPAIHRPDVAAEVARLGLDPTLDLDHRTAILGALDTQQHLAPEILEGLSGVATSDDPGEPGWVAARTVGRVMAAELGRGGDATPYVDRLLQIGASSPDAQVRSVALEMPMHVDVQVDAAASSRLAAIITGDPDPEVRKTAIHDLSLALDRDQALTAYESAFRSEHDVCVRWALFRFTARLAGARALPVMARMAVLDPRFASDLQVFQRIYASGVVDFERVWQSLPDDDPHHCLAVEGEGEES